MSKTLLVIRNEIVTILTRPSFWFAALGIPLMGTVIFAVVGAINKNASAASAVSQIFNGPQQTLRAEGYVDDSGIIRQVPESIAPGTFIAYPDETSARQALKAGDIDAFFVVPADYIQKGKITYVRPDFNPLSATSDQSSLFLWTLQVNLVGGDTMRTNLVNGPVKVEDVSLASAPQPDENNPLAYWAPYVVTLIFYILIIGAASLLLSSVSKEKENRVMEILLMSVTPRQLLSGKIIGLGLVGLGQAVLWAGTSFALMNLSGRTFQLPSSIHLPVSFLFWGLVFFLLGYAVYASLMAGLGALVPNLREASQATFVIILPLIIPLLFSSSIFMQDPNGAIATGLSLFPLTAPVAMMARLSAGGVPWWQPFVAAVLLAATAFTIVRAVAGMFRSQTLLSGQAFNLKVYFRALLGRA